MRRYFGGPPSEEIDLEEQLKRDIAILERDIKKIQRKTRTGKSRGKSKRSNRIHSTSKRTMKHRK